jgi:hypothetical protein
MRLIAFSISHHHRTSSLPSSSLVARKIASHPILEKEKHAMRLGSAFLSSLVFSLGTQQFAQGFVTPVPKSDPYLLKAVADDSHADHQNQEDVISSARRAVLSSAALATGSLMLGGALPEAANAAVGTLPEFSDTNAFIQGLTVNVADKPQQEAMINFLVNGFDFQVLRKRIKDSVEETVRDI